ncbi:MAG: hypothetical protein A2V76_01815 [Candidatus Aminicenantes bacterium RBG_16_63_14]|nr:MAG: hypothetical protein A2V76_01815 [Candidatus Aminicenantes bacterium RBG_16_63_14]OGD27405.1 MAG: hypothetical protein A2V57_00510 [Candidatus Aminicenantes bacterium RBG_19FT_COMBO_65_30]
MRWVKLGLLASWLACSSGFSFSNAPDDPAIWKEFVASLKAGTLTVDRIRPLYGTDKELHLKWLKDLMKATGDNGALSDWDAPEIIPVGNLVHFVVKLRIGREMTTERSLSFIKEGGRWYFGHMENIMIRLDRIPPPPTSEFPPLPEETMTWQRNEILWSDLVRIYLATAKQNGRDFALNLFKTGDGYFVGAKSWVPFVPPARAFILYLCWAESRLYGNLVTLEKLTDEEAVVRMQTHFFFLYQRSSHMRQWLSFEEYRTIFETIWQDRAKNAGWKLAIEYQDPECLQVVLHFTKAA